MLTRKQKRTAPIFINRIPKPASEIINIKTPVKPDTLTEIGYRDSEGFLVLPKDEYCIGDDDYEADFIKLCKESGDDWQEILRR